MQVSGIKLRFCLWFPYPTKCYLAIPNDIFASRTLWGEGNRAVVDKTSTLNQSGAADGRVSNSRGIRITFSQYTNVMISHVRVQIRHKWQEPALNYARKHRHYHRD